jgi:hypothetical protein
MFALADCLPVPAFFRERPMTYTQTTLEKAQKGEAIELLILGASQSGKTKILTKWNHVEILGTFPSNPLVLESSSCSVQFITGPVQFNISSAPDTAVSLLITAYANKADLVIFTYSRAELEQLDLVRDKYLKLLSHHPRLSSLSIMLVGTEAENNPYKPRRDDDISPFLETIKLIALAWKINTELGCRIAFANCIVDRWSSTDELKDTTRRFAFLPDNYQFHDFRSWRFGRK